MSDIDALLVARISKSIGTTAGDLLYWTGASTPARLPAGSNGNVLTLVAGLPAWAGATGTTPGTQIDYAQITAPVAATVTTEATATAIVAGSSVAYDGTRVKIEFWAPGAFETGGANPLTLVVLRDTTVIGQAKVNLGVQAAYPASTPIAVAAFDTPSAANHTYSVAAFQTAGTSVTVQAGAGGSGSQLPAFILVTKA